MDDVERISGQLTEALNQAADQDLELRKLRRALEQAETEAAEVKRAKEQISVEREKLARDLAAAQEAKSRADAELADLSSRLLEDAGERVREANMRAAEAEQRGKDVETRRARQIAEMEENHAQQIAVLQAMIVAGAEADPEKATSKKEEYVTHIPSFGTREVDLNDDDDFAEALEAAQWTSPLRPTARTDLQDYKDFIELANTAATLQQQQQQPGILAPFQRSSSPRMPHLSSIKFAARTIAQDVEPTLRLESAVHLSWLARRAWYSAVVDGTLVIQPVDAKLKAWATRPSNPCCLCGEARTTPQYARLYCVKLPKDPDNYILGLECVVRVRAACEYIAFLRSLRDGVRKINAPGAALAAWQECLKLREEMFWSRTSGFYAMEREAVDRAYVPPTPRGNESPSLVPETLETPKLPEISGQVQPYPNPAASPAQSSSMTRRPTVLSALGGLGISRSGLPGGVLESPKSTRGTSVPEAPYAQGAQPAHVSADPADEVDSASIDSDAESDGSPGHSDSSESMQSAQSSP